MRSTLVFEETRRRILEFLHLAAQNQPNGNEARRLIQDPMALWCIFMDRHLGCQQFHFGRVTDHEITQAIGSIKNATVPGVFRISLERNDVNTLPDNILTLPSYNRTNGYTLSPKTSLAANHALLWSNTCFEELQPQKDGKKNENALSLRNRVLVELREKLYFPLTQSLIAISHDRLRQLVYEAIVSAFYFYFVAALEGNQLHLKRLKPSIRILLQGAIPLATILNKDQLIAAVVVTK